MRDGRFRVQVSGIQFSGLGFRGVRGLVDITRLLRKKGRQVLESELPRSCSKQNGTSLEPTKKNAAPQGAEMQPFLMTEYLLSLPARGLGTSAHQVFAYAG